jgi:hypothetical protein
MNIVLIIFCLIMMILLMSLGMTLMPMEPSVGPFTGAPFEGLFCDL